MGPGLRRDDSLLRVSTASPAAIAFPRRRGDSAAQHAHRIGPRTRMRRLNLAVVDLVTNKPTRALYSRFMNAILASIMGQAAAVWCEELGHRVRYLCYTGAEDILREVGAEVDILFIGAFTRSAQTA